MTDHDLMTTVVFRAAEYEATLAALGGRQAGGRPRTCDPSSVGPARPQRPLRATMEPVRPSRVTIDPEGDTEWDIRDDLIIQRERAERWRAR